MCHLAILLKVVFVLLLVLFCLRHDCFSGTLVPSSIQLRREWAHLAGGVDRFSFVFVVVGGSSFQGMVQQREFTLAHATAPYSWQVRSKLMELGLSSGRVHGASSTLPALLHSSHWLPNRTLTRTKRVPPDFNPRVRRSAVPRHNVHLSLQIRRDAITSHADSTLTGARRHVCYVYLSGQRMGQEVCMTLPHKWRYIGSWAGSQNENSNEHFELIWMARRSRRNLRETL